MRRYTLDQIKSAMNQGVFLMRGDELGCDYLERYKEEVVKTLGLMEDD